MTDKDHPSEWLRCAEKWLGFAERKESMFDSEFQTEFTSRDYCHVAELYLKTLMRVHDLPVRRDEDDLHLLLDQLLEFHPDWATLREDLRFASDWRVENSMTLEPIDEDGLARIKSTVARLRALAQDAVAACPVP